jgi:hypothetical protein
VVTARLAGLLPLDVPIGIDRDEAQRRAAEELAKAKYGGTPQWLSDVADRADRIISWLVDLFIRLLQNQDPSANAGVNWGFVIAVALLITAIAAVVWRVGLPRWRRSRRDATVEVDSTRAAADYRTLADEAAQRGDWAAAVRDRFRALVRELEVQTVLDVRPARTAWEAAYLASRALPGCTEPLHSAAESFNAVVYGDRRADAETYRQMVEVDAAVAAAAQTADLAAADEPAATR